MSMDKDEALRLIKAAQLILLGKDNQPISDLYYALQIAIDSIEERTPQGDLISREALKEEVRKHAEYYADRTEEDRYNVGYTECACEILDFIDNAQTVESKQGEWIDHSETDGYVECPFCGSCTTCEDNKDELHFCFNCGADMRGGSKNE